MFDGILSIGAVFDKGAIETGLESVAENTRVTMEAITTSMVEAGAKTRNAFKGMTDGIKEAATSITAESLKIAEATKEQVSAAADLRRAQVIARDSNVEESVSSALLAAALQRTAAASVELAEAKKAEAESVVEAAEEEALSQNVVIAAFQRAWIAVTEATEGIQERMIETAETAGLEGEGIAAGFAGFSKLLGAGIAVGFAANYIDGIAKINVELEHLSSKTGIEIQSLAGLQQILKEAGGDFETVATGLVKMDRAQQQVIEGNHAVGQAFIDLGISLKDVTQAKPEELLQKLAIAMSQTASAGVRANSAMLIFGRGGQALIPVLREQGAQLTENMERVGKLTGITEDSAAAARRWTQDTAQLSAEFRSVMMPVMEHAEDVIKGIVGVFEGAAAAILSVFEGLATGLVILGKSMATVGKLVYDGLTGNYTAIAGDTAALRDGVVNTWKAGFADIEAYWKEASGQFMGGKQPEAHQEPEVDREFKPRDTTKPFARDEEALNQLKLDHQVTLGEELQFWSERLALAKRGTEEYREIEAQLANLVQRRDRIMNEAQHPKKPPQVQEDDGWLKRQEQDYIQSMRDQVKQTEEAQQIEVEVFRAAREREIQLAEEKTRSLEKDTQFEVEMGRMSAQQRTAILREAVAQQEQIELQAVRALQAVDQQDVKRFEQDENRKVQITRQADRQIVQINQQSAQQVQGMWQQAFDKMTNEMNQDVAKWVIEGGNFQQSMAKAMAGISENFIRNLMKMVEQEILAAAMHKSLMSQKIMADAKSAAANSFEWASSWGGPIAGAVAAAAAFAGVLAFDSFADGGVVRGAGGGAVPVLAHAGERILSQSQTENFHKMVDGSQTNNQRGGDTHLHLQQNVNAYDKTGMRSTLRAHSSDLFDIIKGGVRSGELNFGA